MSLNIIILAGGKGTRIKKVLKETPKIMAPINGKPFLVWLLNWIKLSFRNIPYKVLLSTCIGHEHIEKYKIKNNLNIKCVPEKIPLGTFGALSNVAATNPANNYLVLNGDTIFKSDFNEYYKKFCAEGCSRPLIVLKKNLGNDRYGGYKSLNNSWIFSNEKTEFISLGAFFISRDYLKKKWLSSTQIPFEYDHINNLRKEIMIDDMLFGEDPISAEVLNLNTPFIDIGIPSSLKEAEKLIPKIIRNS